MRFCSGAEPLPWGVRGVVFRPAAFIAVSLAKNSSRLSLRAGMPAALPTDPVPT